MIQRDDVEEEPSAAEDDRLHGVETDELVVLFQDVKNQAPNERNAGEGGGDVGRQAGRARSSDAAAGGELGGGVGRRRSRPDLA